MTSVNDYKIVLTPRAVLWTAEHPAPLGDKALLEYSTELLRMCIRKTDGAKLTSEEWEAVLDDLSIEDFQALTMEAGARMTVKLTDMTTPMPSKQDDTNSQ